MILTFLPELDTLEHICSTKFRHVLVYLHGFVTVRFPFSFKRCWYFVLDQGNIQSTFLSAHFTNHSHISHPSEGAPEEEDIKESRIPKDSKSATSYRENFVRQVN